MNAAGISHGNFHTRLGSTRGIEHAKFEFGVAEHAERNLVLAGPSRQVQEDEAVRIDLDRGVRFAVVEEEDRRARL